MRFIALLPCLGLFANPIGLQVVSGQVILDESKPNVMEIHVTDQSVLEWDDFSIKTNEIARFNQESSHATVLNRVTGPHISTIDGILESNGNVFLLNSSGVLIGKGAIINCRSLFISAIALSDRAFEGKVARLIHRGKITAEDGDVRLVGQVIENYGEIWSRCGDISIEAEELKNYGFLSASSTADVGGKVSLSASNGSIDLHGAIFANGSRAGGEIAILSDSCTIHRTAVLSAQGSETGGAILLKSEKYCFQYGTLLAEGGFIEISGKEGFDLKGNVCAGTLERPGRLLIDPADIDLGIGITTPPAFLFPPAHALFDRPGPFAFLHIPDLISQLENGVSVAIQTSPGAGGLGRIRVLSPISWSQATTLTFIADESIHVFADIENFGTGSLSFTAAQDVLVRARVTANTGNIQITAANFQIESLGSPVQVSASEGGLNVGLTGDLTLLGGMGAEMDAPAVLSGGSVLINAGGSVALTGGASVRNTVEISSQTGLNLQVGGVLTLLGGSGTDCSAKIVSGQSLYLDIGLGGSITSTMGSEALIRSLSGPLQIDVGTSLASDLILTGTLERNASIETFGNLSLTSTQNLNVAFGRITSRSGFFTIDANNQINILQQSTISSPSTLQIASGLILFDQSKLTASSGFASLISTGAIIFQNNSEISTFPAVNFQGTSFSLNQSVMKGGGAQTYQFTGPLIFTNATLLDYPSGSINGADLTIDQSTLHFLNLSAALSGNLILQNGALLNIDNALQGNISGLSFNASTLRAGQCSLAAAGLSTLVSSLFSIKGAAVLMGASLNMTSSTIESIRSTLQLTCSGNGVLLNSVISSASDFSAGFSMLTMDQSTLQSFSSSQSLALTGTGSLTNGSHLTAGRLLTVAGTQLNLSSSTISALTADLVLSTGLAMSMNAEASTPILFSLSAATLCDLNLSSLQAGRVAITVPTLQLTNSTIRGDQSFQIQAQNFTLINSTISDPSSTLQD